jgi:Cu(I)/Ag(I) efflux system membrane fusion protein
MDVDASALSGHAHMVWLELDMFLENDAVVGSQVTSLKEAKRIFAELNKDFEKLRQQFALEHAGHAKGVSAAETEKVPQAFQSQIGETLKAYLSVQDALANDRFNQAQQAMRFLGDVVGSIDMSLLKGEAHTKWMEFFANLQAALTQLGQAEDLETFRKCFALVSEAMALIVETFGIYPQQPVYKIFCPMAFAGQGAIWLQKEKEIRNPYFGEAMSGCGEITETYFEKPRTGEEGHKHE